MAAENITIAASLIDLAYQLIQKEIQSPSAWAPHHGDLHCISSNLCETSYFFDKIKKREASFEPGKESK